MQVVVGFDRGGVITVFPERPVSVLALIVFFELPPIGWTVFGPK
jgi:hypothetical protein